MGELSRSDLEQFPVWEFASQEEIEEGQDESTVRPFIVSGELDPSAGDLVVRARFRLADGTVMTGYVTPHVPPDDGLDSLQPVIITDEGQVLFWRGIIELPSAANEPRSDIKMIRQDVAACDWAAMNSAAKQFFIGL